MRVKLYTLARSGAGRVADILRENYRPGWWDSNPRSCILGAFRVHYYMKLTGGLFNAP